MNFSNQAIIDLESSVEITISAASTELLQFALVQGRVVATVNSSADKISLVTLPKPAPYTWRGINGGTIGAEALVSGSEAEATVAFVCLSILS